MAKSETYQKEGWSVLEDENKVFGPSTENNDDLQDEIWFSKSNIETKKAKLDKSAKDFTEFVTEYLSDVEDIPQEDVDRGVAEILKKAFPADTQAETKATKKTSKITLKVLFIAALLSAIVFSTICVVGKSNNISIENGFVTFTKDAVKIVFFDKNNEGFIDVKTLTEDLTFHSFEDVVLPQKLCDYKVSVPEYSKGSDMSESNDVVVFELSNNTSSYYFKIEKSNSVKQISNYFSELNDAENLVVDGIDIYVFEYEGGTSSVYFVDNNYTYFIQSDVTMSEMINVAQTIIKAEE